MSDLCIICGHRFSDGDLVIELVAKQVVQRGEVLRTIQFPFEDGASKKRACFLCPIKAGAPLSLIGADGRPDV